MRQGARHDMDLVAGGIDAQGVGAVVRIVVQRGDPAAVICDVAAGRQHRRGDQVAGPGQVAADRQVGRVEGGVQGAAVKLHLEPVLGRDQAAGRRHVAEPVLPADTEETAGVPFRDACQDRLIVDRCHIPCGQRRVARLADENRSVGIGRRHGDGVGSCAGIADAVVGGVLAADDEPVFVVGVRTGVCLQNIEFQKIGECAGACLVAVHRVDKGEQQFLAAVQPVADDSLATRHGVGKALSGRGIGQGDGIAGGAGSGGVIAGIVDGGRRQAVIHAAVSTDLAADIIEIAAGGAGEIKLDIAACRLDVGC